MSDHTAAWSISLCTHCPECDEFIDLLEEEPDFWDSGIEPIEHGTPNSKDYEVTCPNCGHEFTVDFEY